MTYRFYRRDGTVRVKEKACDPLPTGKANLCFCTRVWVTKTNEASREVQRAQFVFVHASFFFFFLREQPHVNDSALNRLSLSSHEHRRGYYLHTVQ